MYPPTLQVETRSRLVRERLGEPTSRRRQAGALSLRRPVRFRLGPRPFPAR
jgi:hypothetical protein